MDPQKSTTSQSPPAEPQITAAQIEIREPAFERWQRITETLIAGSNCGPKLPLAKPRSPRVRESCGQGSKCLGI